MPRDRRTPRPRVATLPMYDLPELRDDHRAMWTRLHDALRIQGFDRVPSELTTEVDPHESWRSPYLLLSQTCGYPFASRLRDTVRLVATPCYDAPGCAGPRYRSWLIAKKTEGAVSIEDFHGRRVAINDPDSLSGCKVLEMMLPTGVRLESYFSRVVHTGSHADSLTSVTRDNADLAAIDCVTYDLIRRHRPRHLDGLKIVASGPLLPGLPLITAKSTSDAEVGALRRALARLIASDDFAFHGRRLGLAGVEVLDAEDYDAILDRLARRGKA